MVEDNVDMRRLLAFLVGQEYRLRVARNGREGLEAVRARVPDLVLTDVMMPEMSGTELCAALKANPELASIPVVLVTSKAEREMKIEGLELGADDYVTKPFHPRELLARVRSLVKLRRARQELAVRNALLQSTNEELECAMSDLKEAGAQLVHAERLAAVGELAAGVAHEINNPVNFAMNASRTLAAVAGEVQEVAAQVATIDASDPSELRKQVADLEELRERLHFDESAETLSELTGIVTEGLERTAGLVGDLREFASPGERQRRPADLGAWCSHHAPVGRSQFHAARRRGAHRSPRGAAPGRDRRSGHESGFPQSAQERRRSVRGWEWLDLGERPRGGRRGSGAYPRRRPRNAGRGARQALRALLLDQGP